MLVKEDCGMESSRMEEEDSMSWHSATRPSTFSLSKAVPGGWSFKLPVTWTIWRKECHVIHCGALWQVM